ncbi:putative mechanosensitive ion channel [Lyophyllum shimeji]|uniref:Mechanosensitive ion channel n=1 Tax=Lyophyllum shimeji TaxID=47721 RepID=A0A9P3UHR5_LYOSH|nr:putative mechanosensitive ion channel [Lyophyllum shimeji]
MSVTGAHASSESPPSGLDGSRREQPQGPADFFSTSAEELAASSPPYRSTANLHEQLLPSPAYYPPIKVVDMAKEQTKASVNDDLETPPDEFGTAKSRPTVHYPDDLKPPMPSAPSYIRTDSADGISSRASSIAATDDEDSDDYNWSGEEDLVDVEAKFEEQMGMSKTKPKGWGLKRIITLLFSSLIGSTFIAGVLVVVGVLLKIYWYKPHPTDHRRYVKNNVQAWLFWAAANLVISWYLAMIVDVIPVLVRLFIAASWGHVSEYVKTRIEVYNTTKHNIKPLLYASCAWASWIIIFGHIFNLYNIEEPGQSQAKYTQRLQEVVEFLFFFALVYCVKQMLSHNVAFFFHRTAYKDRIEEVEEALQVIETLRQYRPKVAPRAKKTPVSRASFLAPSPLSDKEHYHSLHSALRSIALPGTHSKGHSYDDAEKGMDADNEDADRTLVNKTGRKWKGKNKDCLSWIHPGGSGSGSGGQTPEQIDNPTPDPEASEHEMDVLPPSQRSSVFFGDSDAAHNYPPSSPTLGDGGAGAEAPLTHAAKVLKQAVLHDARNIKGKNIGEGSMAWNINSTKEATRLARSLFTRLKDRRRNYILPSDFYPAFPDEASAKKAFRVFDRDNNGDISRAELKSRVVKVYKERRFLSRSMRDVGAALKTLDHILLLFAMIILFFIGLSVFGVNVGDSLTSVYSIGIAASFIFKNSASSAFDSIMFLFVTHPYDTGDRCFIDEEVLVVKKVGLFATVFTRADGTESYYFNSQLFTKFITNVRRSGKTFENLTMQVAWRTPLEKLDMLEKLMNEWLSTEENRWFEPSTSVVLQQIEFQQYLTVTLGIGHNGNWQVWPRFFRMNTYTV